LSEDGRGERQVAIKRKKTTQSAQPGEKDHRGTWESNLKKFEITIRVVGEGRPHREGKEKKPLPKLVRGGVTGIKDSEGKKK